MKATLLIIKNLFVLSFFIFASSSSAQLFPFAPNDNSAIPGYALTIPQHLTQGKPVIIDVFDVYCDDCFSYLQSGVLNQFYNDYGPNGSDEVLVVAMEINEFSTYSMLYNPIPGMTAGDWVNEFQYPFIENDSFEYLYGMVELPAVIWICPNGTMSEVGQLSYLEFEGLLDTQCLDPVFSGNLAINGNI